MWTGPLWHPQNAVSIIKRTWSWRKPWIGRNAADENVCSLPIVNCTVKSIKHLEAEKVLWAPKWSGLNQIVVQQPLRQTTEIALGPRFAIEVPIVKKSDILIIHSGNVDSCLQASFKQQNNSIGSWNQALKSLLEWLGKFQMPNQITALQIYAVLGLIFAVLVDSGKALLWAVLFFHIPVGGGE